MATGIDNLGQSLLVGRDQGRAEKEERKEAQRRTRARERDQAARKGALLTLGGNLLNSYFSNKYEDFSKREELQIAKRLSDQNKKERDKFENIAIAAQSANLTVPEYLVQNTKENYNTLKDKGLINSTTLMGPDQDKLFETTVDRHVNNYVYGENYEVGKDDTIDSNSLFGKYKATQEALKGVDPEDFNTSADLLKQMQESNPNAKNVQQKFLRLLNFKGMNSTDRKEAAEQIIATNLGDLKSRNEALTLFNQGFSLQDSVGMAQAEKDFINSNIPLKKDVTKTEIVPQHTIYIGGKPVIVRALKTESRLLNGAIAIDFSADETSKRSVAAFNSQDKSLTTTEKKEFDIFGRELKVETTHKLVEKPDGTSSLVAVKQTKNYLPVTPGNLISDQKLQAQAFLDYDNAKPLLPEDTRDILTNNLTKTAEGIINYNSNIVKEEIAAQRGSIHMGARFLNLSEYVPQIVEGQDTALSAIMMSLDMNYKQGILSGSNPMRQFLAKVNEAYQTKTSISQEDFQDVTINPFVMLAALDQLQLKLNNPEKSQILKTFIEENKTKFGLEGNPNEYFANSSLQEREYMLSIVKAQSMNENSIFNNEIISGRTADGTDISLPIGIQLLGAEASNPVVEEEKDFIDSITDYFSGSDDTQGTEKKIENKKVETTQVENTSNTSLLNPTSNQSDYSAEDYKRFSRPVTGSAKKVPADEYFVNRDGDLVYETGRGTKRVYTARTSPALRFFERKKEKINEKSPEELFKSFESYLKEGDFSIQEMESMGYPPNYIQYAIDYVKGR